MDKQKLIHQLFIGKVAEIIGQEKAIELLREAKTAIESIEPQLPLGDVIKTGCSHKLPDAPCTLVKCTVCGDFMDVKEQTVLK